MSAADSEDGSSAAFWNHMEMLEKVQQDVTVGELQLGSLRETLAEYDQSPPALIKVSLRMLPQLRRCAALARHRIHNELFGHQFYDVNLLTPDYKAYSAQPIFPGYIRPPFRGDTYRVDRDLQDTFNVQMRRAFRSKWEETNQQVDQFLDAGIRYYRHLLLKAAEFHLFLQHYCNVPPPDTAQSLADREPWLLQHLFHMLFHGGFMCHPEGEVGINWVEAPKNSQSATRRHYTPCQCGCKAAAERFFANMGDGGADAVERAMFDRYHECMDPNAPFIM